MAVIYTVPAPRPVISTGTPLWLSVALNSAFPVLSLLILHIMVLSEAYEGTISAVTFIVAEALPSKLIVPSYTLKFNPVTEVSKVVV